MTPSGSRRRTTRSRSSNVALLAVVLTTAMATAAACLPGCAPRDTGQAVEGSSAQPSSKSPGSKPNKRTRSNIPDAAGSPTGSPTAPLSATDPCATRLHELSGPLLQYYALNRRLPEGLEELAELAGPDPAISFECPISGQPYVYVPGGIPWGDKPAGYILLHDAEPSHSGFRWAVVVEEPQPGQPLVTRVVAVPEPLFLRAPKTGDGDGE